MLKVIIATRKSMPKFQGQIFLETLDLSQIFLTNLKKQKCYLNKRIDWEHILGEKNFMPRYLKKSVKKWGFTLILQPWYDQGVLPRTERLRRAESVQCRISGQGRTSGRGVLGGRFRRMVNSNCLADKFNGGLEISTIRHCGWLCGSNRRRLPHTTP